MTTYREFSDDELIKKFTEMDYYDPELCALICERAGLSERWNGSNGESFDSVLCLAIERLTGA